MSTASGILKKDIPVKLNSLFSNYIQFRFQSISTTMAFVISMEIVVVHNLENAMCES